MKNSLTILIGIAIILAVIVSVVTLDSSLKDISKKIATETVGEINSASCTVTHTTVSIGNQEATTVLAAASNRAWATLQQPVNATNTVSVSLGGTATDGTGFILTDLATTTGKSDSLSFGRNADLPYVGAVSAITNNASTTILATQCLY